MSDRQDATSGIVAATIGRGDALVRKGKYRRAIQLWRNLLEAEIDEVEPARGLIQSRIASAYFRLGRNALKRGANRKSLLRAVERLRLALRYENRPEYSIELARCFLRLGQLERADEVLAKVLASAPSNEMGLYYAAVTKIRRRDVAAAERLTKQMRSTPASTHEGWWKRLEVITAAVAGDVARALSLARVPFDGVPLAVWTNDVLALTKAATPAPQVAAALDAILESLERMGGNGASELGALAGDMYAHMGEYEAAVRYWADAAEGGENRSLIGKIALICERQIIQAIEEGALDQALAWYRRGVECGVERMIKPLESTIHFYRAKEAWMRSDYHGAVTGFSICLKWRRSLDIARYLAVSYESQGDWVNAATAWETVYELASHERPGVLPEAARRQGLAYLRAGAYEKANVALQRSLEIDADDEISLYLGCSLIQLGDVGAAVSLFSKALEDSGENPKLLVGLAIAIELAERGLEEKVAAWRRAAFVCQEPWVYRIWRRRHLELARERLDAGHLERALECYVSLLAQDLEDGESWAWCGAVHLKRGRSDIAKKCFDQALQVSPSANIAVHIGEHLLQAGHEEAAREYFNRAVELNPVPMTEIVIARIILKCGKRANGLDHLRRALSRCGKCDPHLAQIAHLAVLAGQAEPARRILAEIVRLSEDPSFPRLLLAAQDITLGRWHQAAEGIKSVEERAGATHDLELSADAAYFHKALQRAMAARRIDDKEFHSRQEALALRWVERLGPSELRAVDEREQLLAWTRRQLYIAEALDPKDAEAIEKSEIPLPSASLPELFPFGRPLPVHRLLAYEPNWNRKSPQETISGR